MWAYEVDCDHIADLTTETGRAEFGVPVDDMACPWFLLAADGDEPLSWAIARHLIAEGHASLLAPSGRLPRNRLSWADK